MKRFLALAFGLGLAGDLAAIFIGPKMIHYWFEPPVQSGANAAFNCTGALDYGIQRLITLQLWGTAFGIFIGAIIAVLLWRRAKNTVVPVAAAPAPAAKA